ncbi:hypothetical protein Moror_7774 [Moniliophthora roreri MCA 2997]|uniref:DUF6533 domain-containing protein n=1 Tax=Moniliophthora roreri (strain MCA 2997) TaxID=1381753 RepID=V2X8V1_MONRO|nr:hypothetical protein Moror_7774 [Moniliophthora roreri MCA 2997]
MDYSGHAESQPAQLAGSYIAVATMGMFLWDVLINLSDEYHFVLKRRITFATIAYLCSRITTLAGLIGATLVLAAPIGRYCPILLKAILIGLPAFVASESLLLFFRLRAVYMDRKAVVRAFFISLLIIVGCSTLIPFVGQATQISPENRYCTVAKVNPALGEAMLIVPLVNHIAVFFAISFRLMPAQIWEESSCKRGSLSKVKAFFRTRNLPLISRTLVIDGQRYILAFILTTIIASVTMAIGSLPDIYRFVLITPHIAIENSMNCYLFRSIREKALTPGAQITESTVHFASCPQMRTEDSTIRSAV